MGPNHPNLAVLRGSLVIPAEEFLVGEHHARQVQRLQLPFATDRERAHPLQHVTAKVQSCQARCGCQFRRTDEFEASRLEILVQRAPQRRARHVQRAVPTEHAQSLPRRLVHGRLDLGQDLTRSPPLQRTGLVRSTTTQLLELRLDALQRPVWPHRTHFAWLSAFIEPLAQLGDVLHCPVSATTHGAKVANTRVIKRTIQRLFERSSASIIIMMTSPRARYAPRRVHLTTTQQWPE